MNREEFKQHVDNVANGFMYVFDQRALGKEPSMDEEEAKKAEASMEAIETWDTQGLAFGGEGGDV